MLFIARSLISAGRVLFPSRRLQMIVVGLATLAAAVSVAELGTAQIFASLILPEDSLDRNRGIALAVAFFVLFGVIRVVHYAQTVLRVKVFERALVEEEVDRRADSWRWASAMELVGILTLLARGAVVAVVVFWLSPLFGLINLIGCLIVLSVLGLSLRRQYSTQREFRQRQIAKAPASNAERVRARIISGERGSLFAGLVVMVLLGVLMFFAVDGEIAAGTAFVVFLAVRMEAQMFNGLSPGLMRFARAQVSSEPT